MKIQPYLKWTFLFLFNYLSSFSIYIDLNSKRTSTYIGEKIEFYIDESSKLDIGQIIKLNKFNKSSKEVPNLGFVKGNVWIKISIKNTEDEEKKYLLELETPLIDEAELFSLNGDEIDEKQFIGQTKKFKDRKYTTTTYLFDINVGSKSNKLIYLRIKSSDQIEIPLKLGTELDILTNLFNKNFCFGLYFGVMLITLLYNLFIYFSVKDKNYLFYVVYVLSILLTQLTFQGYTFKYLWPNLPLFEVKSIHIMSIMVGFTSVQFLRSFLQTKLNLPKYDKVFFVAFVFYAIAAIVLFFGEAQISWLFILSIVSPLSMFMLFVSIKLALGGNRSAKIFTYAWVVFLIGVFLYALKDFGIIPCNAFTVYTMPVGSAIETLLLSFALADRINIMKVEKEHLNRQSLLLLEENQRIIKEQNVQLEKMVLERTSELEKSNARLKEIKLNLINSEKLASIGQLTAGISHEINNPINFVTGSVKPLQRDVDEILNLLSKYIDIKSGDEFDKKKSEIIELLKNTDLNELITEINFLIRGISDGATRTSNIVKSLRLYSRLDENEFKEVNIVEGLESTIVLLNNIISNSHITIERDYNKEVLLVCNPGRINQVFMNILTNSIYALNKKEDSGIKKIRISINKQKDKVEIKISDNGIGIPNEIMSKIFEPFYTTKEVGEGTGMGLSIVQSIINEHKGRIIVNSTKNKETSVVLIFVSCD